MPLYQHVMVGRRLLDLFASSDVDAAAGLRQGGRAGQRRADPDRPRRLGQHPADARPALAAQGQARARRRARGSVGNGRRVWIPSRGRRRRPARPRGAAAGDRLHLQPGRVRRRRDQQCLNAGVRLTTPRGARRRSSRSSRRRCRHLPDEDLHVLGYHDFLDGLTRGVAAHHAGMLPAFKQCVEELFVRGPRARSCSRPRRWRSGINMPARTVVIEKLIEVERRDPRRHHAGGVHPAHRAGRAAAASTSRATASCSGSPGMNPGEVAGLASTRTYPLRSSFRPSYNMAVNLVHQFGRETLPRAARAVLRAVPGRQGRGRAGPAAAQGEEALEGYAEAATLPPRRLHGVRRPAPPDLRHREGRQQGAPCRPPRGGDRVAAPAATRRRDRGARPASSPGIAVVIDPGCTPATTAALRRSPPTGRPAGSR